MYVRRANMRYITALFMLASITLLSVTPVVEGKESIQWLKGEEGFEAASEMAEDEKKLLLLDFFHPN
jgi:hypothetical protein